MCGCTCVRVYMCGGVCAHTYTHMDGKGQLSEVKSLLSQVGSFVLQECEEWNLNSYPQAWWQDHLPTEPSCWHKKNKLRRLTSLADKVLDGTKCIYKHHFYSEKRLI